MRKPDVPDESVLIVTAATLADAASRYLRRGEAETAERYYNYARALYDTVGAVEHSHLIQSNIRHVRRAITRGM